MERAAPRPRKALETARRPDRGLWSCLDIPLFSLNSVRRVFGIFFYLLEKPRKHNIDMPTIKPPCHLGYANLVCLVRASSLTRFHCTGCI